MLRRLSLSPCSRGVEPGPVVIVVVGFDLRMEMSAALLKESPKSLLVWALIDRMS